MSLTTFAQEVFSDFQKTAAIAPSSRFLARAMVDPLPLAGAKVVVEFGPGTGVMTRELLALTPPWAVILAFEVNPRFVEYLRQEITDPRLKVIAGGAETVGQELQRLGCGRVDAVLSSLGLTLMSEPQIHRMLGGLMPYLDAQSVFTQFQYVQRVRFQDGRVRYCDVGRILEAHFRAVKRRTVWRNLPPAFVFDCRK